MEQAAFWEDLNLAVDEDANAEFWRHVQPMPETMRTDRFATNNIAITTESDLFEDDMASERKDTGGRVRGQGAPQPPVIRRSAEVASELLNRKRPPDAPARERLEALRRRVCGKHLVIVSEGA